MGFFTVVDGGTCKTSSQSLYISIKSVTSKDLVWPDYYHPPSNLNEWWNGASHPVSDDDDASSIVNIL